MGVMPCSRKDCDNIMCDSYIDDVGYVCGECQREFEDMCEKMEHPPKTVNEISVELQKFMATPKKFYSPENNEEISVYDFFKKHSRH